MVYIKKAFPYRETETGVRIPVHKIKWMSSPESNKSKTKTKGKNKDSDFMFPISQNYSDLVASNFNAFMQYSNAVEADDLLAESSEASNPEESD